ncbi:AI-2E family transporter [Natronobiforma cellulositropha]
MLVAAFAYLSFLLVVPFAQYVLAALLIAYILYPLRRRLVTYTSPTVAAFALVLLAVVAIIFPFVLVLALVAEDAARVLGQLDGDLLELDALEETIEEIAGFEADVATALEGSGRDVGMTVLEQSPQWVATFTHALVGLGLALFVLYYLLKDGGNLYEWVRELTPLPEDVQDDLYDSLDEVMAAVLIGHVLIAVVQGAIAGAGLFATGIPNATLWTVVMVILALVPLVGTFLVWGPAVGYLLFTGEPLLALALFVYSAIIVGVSDDYLRPIVVDRYAELSPAVIIVGVLGGIYAFGVMGLFFGPVVLGALIATLEVVDEHYGRLEGDRSE